MAFSPAQLVGQSAPELIAQLAALAPAEFPPPSEVELFSVSVTLDEAITVRPASLLHSTLDDADLPAGHPDVQLPGVVLEEYLGGGGQGWVYAGRVRDTG